MGGLTGALRHRGRFCVPGFEPRVLTRALHELLRGIAFPGQKPVLDHAVKSADEVSDLGARHSFSRQVERAPLFEAELGKPHRVFN